MNERIKLLAEQARLISVNDTTRYASDDEFEQKFAQLIVRECIDVVEDAGGIDKYHYTGAIGKHFGVEE